MTLTKIALPALIAAAALLTACSTKPNKQEQPNDTPSIAASTDAAAEEQTETAAEEPTLSEWFKAGTWDGNCRYFFYEETQGRHSGATRDFTMGIGVAFEYEHTGGSEYVFHMGAAEDNTAASVVFSDGANEAVITWEDGTAETLTYVSEEFIEPEMPSTEAAG